MFIWYLWPTVSGKSHDYTMLKNEFLEKKEIFLETNLMLDLGYQWFINDFWETTAWILIPEKKDRKSKKKPNPELTLEQKESNKIISSFRIKVENAIGWAKRLGIVSQIFRNKSEVFNDDVMEIACGLWNLHLIY
jgi:hypothetical protein